MRIIFTLSFMYHIVRLQSPISELLEVMENEQEKSCLNDGYEVCETCKNDSNSLFRWDPVKVGYEREIEIDGSLYKIKTMAVRPPVFVVDNFLTDNECDYIISQATENGLFDSDLHMDDDALKHKNYSKSSQATALTNWYAWDTNNDGKISVPSEIRQLAYHHNFLYLSDEEINEILEKFNIELAEDVDGSNEKYIGPSTFELMNKGGIAEYLSDMRERNPKHRDRFSSQTWLRITDPTNMVFAKIYSKLKSLTNLSQEIMLGAEPMQVLRYNQYGHYHAHFDSQSKLQHPNKNCCHLELNGTASTCRLCRYMTVLYFLSEVEEGGETAFVVSDQEEFKHEDFVQRKTGDLYNLSQFCKNASLAVKPKKGRVIMWYNHLKSDDGWLGELDEYSLHGGCDVIKGVKWIGNTWIPAPEADSRHLISIFSPNYKLV